MSDLNEASFFRKGGLATEMAGRNGHTEVGRNALDGSWYIDVRGPSGHVRTILTPEQAFNLFKGGMIAMARFQPERIGEIRSLLGHLAPHA